MAAGKRRTVLLQAFENVLERMEQRIAAFDATAAAQAADLLATGQRKGRPGDLRDTMIAGIVLAHHIPAGTRNTGYFEDVAIPVLNPWTA